VRAYFALHGTVTHHGAYHHCLDWCRRRVTGNSTSALVLTARAGQKTAKVIAEITAKGERIVLDGRLVPIRKLRDG
jgi:hypothetical protein